MWRSGDISGNLNFRSKFGFLGLIIQKLEFSVNNDLCQFKGFIVV